MGKAGVVILVIIFALGVTIGKAMAGSPAVETRTVTVPKYITHVETKEVIKAEPMPESCKTSLSLIESVNKFNAEAETAGSEMMQLINDASKELGVGDLPASVPYTQKLIVAKNKFDNAVTSAATAKDNLDRLMLKCATDTK